MLHTWPAQDVHAFLHFSRSYSRAGASRFAPDWSTAQHRLLHSGTQCVVASATIFSQISVGRFRTREKSVRDAESWLRNNRRRATCATRLLRESRLPSRDSIFRFTRPACSCAAVGLGAPQGGRRDLVLRASRDTPATGDSDESAVRSEGRAFRTPPSLRMYKAVRPMPCMT